ncbi:MAG TPA: glycosyltransferase family 2 protein [Desulfomonilaceae bacterium]|nr:glycosyltransferase family 2 protein [Desulfomonilaceae bacterium]
MDTPAPLSTKPIVLSLVVITKNEADRIGRLLKSATIADEIIVVDSGSSDNTVDMCRAHGARVIRQEWLGYTAQKQLAMDTASGEWILNVDADESLSADSAKEILDEIRHADAGVNGFSMPRMSWYLNRWIRHGGWYPDRKVRLVRRGRGKWTGDGLHERLEVEGTVRKLEHPLLHYVYRDISDQVKTINRFSSLTADHRKRSASSLYLLMGIFHAVGKFLECAVWKLGFLDGLPGMVIAVNSAFYVFLKHAKAWEKGLHVSHHVGEATPE